MSNDVSEELLKKINKTFTLSYQNSRKIKKLLEAINKKECDYEKSMNYAEEVGRILADAYMKNLSSDVLPDGKMYYDIASAILNPTLENNYGLISSYVCDSMEVLNKKAGINVKARKPSYNINKTLGLIKKVSDADHFDDVKKYLNEPVITNALSIIDEGARVNADLHYNLGYIPVIKRIASFGCCKWCRGLEGIVEYDPRMDRDIFRRHTHCRCRVIYDPGDSDGKVQDVWSKKWAKSNNENRDSTQALSIQKEESSKKDKPEGMLKLDLQLFSEFKPVPLTKHVRSELNTWLRHEEIEKDSIVAKEIGNYKYYLVYYDFDSYVIIKKEKIK